MQDCGAAIVAASTGYCVVPAHITTSILVQATDKREDAMAGLNNFERHRPTENETAGGKCSRLECSRAQARIVESGGSGDSKTAIGTCAVALSNFAHYVERLLCGIGEGAAQVVTDIPNIETGEPSLVAGITSTVDSVSPVEGEAGEIPGECNDLSVNGRGGQRCTVRSRSPRQAQGG